MSSDRPRRIVSDTGPIISLEKLTGGFGFISRLYEQVLVPTAVMNELVAGQFESPSEYLRHFNAEDILVVQDPERPGSNAYPMLDPGEQQAIQLASELELDLLIEEEAGRQTAENAGLHISGIAGQLLKATSLNVLSANEASARLAELRDASRINRRVFDAVLAGIIRNEV